MSIIADTSDIPQDHMMIHYSEDHSSYYFEINILEQLTRFWLNVIPNELKLPDLQDSLYFIYDFFSSGEIYISIPENKSINSVSVDFARMYAKHFLSDKGILRKYPEAEFDPISINSSTIVSKTYSPSYDPFSDSEQVSAWLFTNTDYFNLIDSESVKKNKKLVPSVCEYYSVSNSKLTLISPHYKFANIPDDMKCCSCPSLTGGKFATCPFQSMGNKITQSSCVAYKPLIKVLKKDTVKIFNTNETFDIELRYSLGLDGSHTFTIINLQNDSIISHLNYPSDQTYDDLLTEIERIYSEYVSCYNLDSIENNNPEVTSLVKESYILSLVGNE